MKVGDRTDCSMCLSIFTRNVGNWIDFFLCTSLVQRCCYRKLWHIAVHKYKVRLCLQQWIANCLLLSNFQSAAKVMCYKVWMVWRPGCSCGLVLQLTTLYDGISRKPFQLLLWLGIRLAHIMSRNLSSWGIARLHASFVVCTVNWVHHAFQGSVANPSKTVYSSKYVDNISILSLVSTMHGMKRETRTRSYVLQLADWSYG